MNLNYNLIGRIVMTYEIYDEIHRIANRRLILLKIDNFLN